MKVKVIIRCLWAPIACLLAAVGAEAQAPGGDQLG